MFEAVEKNGSQSEPQREQHEPPAALAEKKGESNPKEAARENPAAGMLGGAAWQVNVKERSRGGPFGGKNNA